jgi:hypothetical protein
MTTYKTALLRAINAACGMASRSHHSQKNVHWSCASSKGFT